jgi:hypothetical protein
MVPDDEPLPPEVRRAIAGPGPDARGETFDPFARWVLAYLSTALAGGALAAIGFCLAFKDSLWSPEGGALGKAVGPEGLRLALAGSVAVGAVVGLTSVAALNVLMAITAPSRRRR